MLQDSVAMRLRRAYLTLHRAAATHFARHGASVEQYVLLSVLADEDGLTQRQLRDEMDSDDNTIAAMVRVLEQRELIERTRCPDDGRARRVWLTPAGRELQQRLLQSAQPFHRAIEESISPAEVSGLFASLDRIREVSQKLAASD